MKILVIDDEPNIRLLLQEIFVLKGYEADLAENGIEGLRLIKENHYDLVLLDRKMPVMSGDETLIEIRKFSDVPVFLVSAFQTDGQIQAIIAKGATGVLMKPFTIDEVVKIAEKFS
ncbi:response regulator [Macrococcoides caseolyticum]|uniref:response regulator n=1 Tax=Macrococcoides caseolyticum TaxID=69966 RepID=UPI001F28EC92|nr:response regulator [Macrococcus caseolyticus]MCE4957574.1 response regulator [Macrococcus caseolyticus]